MPKQLASRRFSRDVIQLLVERGMTMTGIAKVLGVTKSYISRVAAGTRALTIEHLMRLEDAVGEPLPWLLVDAIPLASVPKDLRPLYYATRRLLKPVQRRSRRVRAA